MNTTTPNIPEYLTTNVPYGDFTHPNKQPTTTRFYSININGLAMSRGMQRSQFIANQTAGSAVDVLGLIATDTNWTNDYRAKFISTFKHLSTQTRVHFSHIATPLETAYQPGGNCAAVLGNTTKFCTGSESDLLGRWVTTIFEPSPSTPFAYIVAYCPTESGPNSINTSWRQQFLQFECMGTPCISPGVQFFHNLQLHISSLKNKG
jgi:hypothetical protein